MKISSKGRYGLAAMVELARLCMDKPVTLSVIARKQEISLNYLEQLFGSLRKAGLVVSVKGPNGGYKLKKPPRNTNCKEILEALEGTFSVVEQKEESSSMERCLYEQVFKPLSKEIEDYLDDITLEKLVLEYESNNDNEAYMYYI